MNQLLSEITAPDSYENHSTQTPSHNETTNETLMKEILENQCKEVENKIFIDYFLIRRIQPSANTTTLRARALCRRTGKIILMTEIKINILFNFDSVDNIESEKSDRQTSTNPWPERDKIIKTHAYDEATEFSPAVNHYEIIKKELRLESYEKAYQKRLKNMLFEYNDI